VLLGGEFTLYWMPSKAVTATSKQLPISAAAEQNSRKQISQNPNPLSLSLSLSQTQTTAHLFISKTTSKLQKLPLNTTIFPDNKKITNKNSKNSLSLSLNSTQLSKTVCLNSPSLNSLCVSVSFVWPMLREILEKTQKTK